MPHETSQALGSHSEIMDRIYRIQRHIYDFTRKYFLFGRDTLINRIQASSDPGTILEIGCGTGRNLAVISQLFPDAHICGLDASSEMLKQSAKNLRSYPSTKTALGYAEAFKGEEIFSIAHFECVIFSYSLSMIPDWKGALENGFAHLSPNGTLWIVDFWDQQGYPKWFRRVLAWWLNMFHVRFEPLLMKRLEELAENGSISLDIQPVGRRYAYIAKITPSSPKIS